MFFTMFCILSGFNNNLFPFLSPNFAGWPVLQWPHLVDNNNENRLYQTVIHSLFYHFKYIWNLIETLFALWEALSEAVNGREDLARRLLSYTYMCHQHDLSALGANVGLLRRFIRSKCESVQKICCQVLSARRREGGKQGHRTESCTFFSPHTHTGTVGHSSKRSTAKKMIKCGVKVSKKSLSEKCTCIWQNTSVVYHCDADWRRHTAGIKGQCEKSQQKFQCSDRLRKETSNPIWQNCSIVCVSWTSPPFCVAVISLIRNMGTIGTFWHPY